MGKLLKLQVILHLCLSFISDASAYEMLLIMPAGTKSHKIFYEATVNALVERGHKMTFIHPFKPSKEVKNVREVTLPNNFADLVFENAFEASTTKTTNKFTEIAPKACLDTMKDEQVKKVLEEEYDLIFTVFGFSDCYLPYIHQKKVPFIQISPNTLVPPYSEAVGMLELPSLVPSYIMDAAHPLSFQERALSVFITLASHFFTHHVLYAKFTDALVEEGKYPTTVPPMQELYKNANLAILNKVRTLENPQIPYPASVIFAGGIHIKPQGNVPQDLQKWMDNSGDEGFVLFSLGSHAKPSHMNNEHLRTIINVFGKLDQRVLLKWDGDSGIEDLPANIKLISWLPQQDVLAHPKIRLFISHGGLLSTQESTYFAVPMVGMPIFADQHHNIAQVVSEGWAKKVDWSEMSEERFGKAIRDSIEDRRMKEEVIRRSEIMRDLPRSPAEEVNYWVEYVIRHNGAPHLKTPIPFTPWYKLYNVDVYALATSIIFVVLMLLLFTLKWFMNCCCRLFSVGSRKNKMKTH